MQTADGTRIFYRDWGQGRAVVFLASAGISCDIWQYQMAHISETARCVGYDRRGHGRSDDPGRGYEYDTLADDLAALITKLDLHDVTLVGHSMAGGEIVRYLTRHGDDRIAGAVLVAVTLPYPLQTGDNPTGVEPARVEATRAGWRHDWPLWLEQGAPGFFGEQLPIPRVSKLLADRLIHDMAGTSLRAVLDCSVTVFETDFREELATVRVPTLVIHGDRDVSTPIESSGRRAAALIPGCELKVYENAPHGLMFTHTDQLNGDLDAFVSR
jgi:pimeloyl-ACP methyl ester carboxylesterase